MLKWKIVCWSLVTIDGKAAGLIGVADPIKDSTPEAIADLHQEGLRVVMLTGDSRTTAMESAGVLYPVFGVLLSPDVLIFESGGVESSLAEYEGHHMSAEKTLD